MIGPRKIVALVVMHFDASGDLSIHIADDAGAVVVLTVDDRCPDDRVYEHLLRERPEDVLAVAPRPWGHCEDDQHEQAKARVLRHMNGLTVVPTGDA